MGQRTSSRKRVHPALEITHQTHIFTKPSREYLTDGKTLVRSPPPLGAPPGSHTLIFADGSYIIGRISDRTYQANGYCEYRDIANRLIYTGYMRESTYNGWGSIWDETGSWPEYTTYWCESRPGNRVLHITPPTPPFHTIHIREPSPENSRVRVNNPLRVRIPPTT
jgi:hypothetical protein